MAAPRTLRTTLLVLLGAALLHACAGPAPAPPVSVVTAEPGDFPRDRYQGLPGNSVYRITASALTLQVYRAGSLKHLGHNHVITSADLRGLIYLPKERAQVGAAFADLYLPVTSLVVDDPQARARAGEEFAAPVADADRDGTRANMLGPRVLDAQRYPYVIIAIAPRTVSTAELEITFKNEHYQLTAPVDWHRTNGGLSAATSFTLTHESIGLTPFSILGGAIAVADGIDVSLQVEATLTSFSQPGS